MRYSIQPIVRIFVKDYRFQSFAENMSKNVGKNTENDTEKFFW